MNGQENLKPVRSKEEARERGRKGGIASGKSRREKKTLKEELLLLLSQSGTQKKLSLALIEKGLSGDTKAFEVIRDTIGQKPIEKVVVSEIDPDVIAEIEEMVENDT